MEKNIANTLIAGIYVFAENLPRSAGDAYRFLDHPKVHVIAIDTRPSFKHFIDFANQELHSCLVAVCNSDVYFDETLGHVHESQWDNQLWCISRYNIIKGSGQLELQGGGNQGSYDAWIFRSPLPDFNSDILLGVIGCDSYFVQRAADAGIRTKNPCLSVILRHLHQVQERNDQPGGFRYWDLPDYRAFIVRACRLNEPAPSFIRNLASSAYKKLTDALPPAVAAGFDWHFDRSLRAAFGGPFNGQARRIAMFRQISQALPLRAIVETGAYCGSTTEFLRAATNLPVHAVEIQPRSYYYSAIRFRNDAGVKLALGDSRRFLRRLAHDPKFPHDSVFFYLDAHWQDDVPLAEELELIAANWSDPVIMIDDFQVPDDQGYGFDSYRNGLSLTLDYLPLAKLSPLRLFWPGAAASEETGHRRGCVVLAPPGAVAERLAAQPALRPAQPCRSAA